MTEHDEQVALIQWARASEGRYPELAMLYAIPNGGARHPAVASKLKREGVRAGVPDLCLPVSRHGFHGLYIEMKTMTGEVSKAQREYLAALVGAGYQALVCYGVDDAIDTIEGYLR